MIDAINHPPHYNFSSIEPIDVIEDWQLGFHLGNAVKYIARAEHKGTARQDLRKALWYLQRMIDQKLIDFGSRPIRIQPEDVAADWKLSDALRFVLVACATRRGLQRAVQLLAQEAA